MDELCHSKQVSTQRRQDNCTSDISATSDDLQRLTPQTMTVFRMVTVLSILVIVAFAKGNHAGGRSGAGNLRALAATSHCADFKRIKLQETLRSNLGGKGPHTAEPEGIVYAASDYESAGANPIRLHINVEDKDADGNYIYTPAYAGHNGIYGLFGEVNLRGGNKVTLVFTATDLSDRPITITEFDISFFDIDIGSSGLVNTTEAITIYPGWTAVHVSSETQLQTIDGIDGSVTYRASMLGRNRDSPSDPEVLDAWQFNKAVTVRYDNFQSARITLHADGGTSGRYFSFILEPTILCVDAGVRPDTILAATTTAAPADTCCLLLLGPVQLVCTDRPSRQFYHFMCTEGGGGDEVEPAPNANLAATTTAAPAMEDKCCLLLFGPVQLVCTDRPSRQFYHFMCTEGRGNAVEPAPSSALNNSSNVSECCIANSGPVVIGCVPKDEARFYHFRCTSSSAFRQSKVEIANSCVLMLLIIQVMHAYTAE